MMNKDRIKKIAGIGIFTAIVVVLQLLGSFIKFGPFSISLVLIPIVVGAAIYGPFAGLWLGFVFGFVVLVSGDAAPFLAFNVFGTILTVILKGSLAGLASGVVFKTFKGNKLIASILSSLVCPIVNTGVFLIGCMIFFLPLLDTWAKGLGFNDVYGYMIVGLVGVNFIFELLTNAILSPVIVKIINVELNSI